MTATPAEVWSALGNVYGIVERPPALDAESARRTAAGTDGVVEVLCRTETALDVLIWNPDGSQAEMSGNATRIAAWWLARATGAREIIVRVGEREVLVRVLEDDLIEQRFAPVTVGAPLVVAGIETIPVSVGNPHAVVFDDPEKILRIGPLLETHPSFPGRTNVQVAQVLSPGHVRARVWERGVGETSSSGTSAIAVAAATGSRGDVVVSFPGGDLTVTVGEGEAWLQGPAPRLLRPQR